MGGGKPVLMSSLTLSHVDCVWALGDLPAGKGDVDGVLAFLGGLVGAAVAAVALVLDLALHGVLLASWVHDDDFHLPNTSTLQKHSKL